MSLPDPDTFLSGERGSVTGRRARLERALRDAVLDARAAATRTGRRLDDLAERTPARDVLVMSVYRSGGGRLADALAELRRSRHRVQAALGSMGPAAPALGGDTVASELSGGKFPNLNAVLSAAGTDRAEADWLLVIDDDVRLPRRFLDRFVALCEHFGLALAQPAQTQASHAAWDVVRRRPRSLVRETRFVEIGPVTAFRRDAAEALTPFPDLRFGWGLDLHWSAVAAERGWRLGIADAVPVRHAHAPVGAAYSTEQAIDEARRFLAERPFTPAAEARRTLATHRGLRR